MTLFLKNETVNLLKWRKYWGHSPHSRASATLFLMFANGCDYNGGLTPYGYFTKDIVSAAQRAIKGPPIVRIEDENIKVHLGQLRRSLKDVVRRRPKKRPRDPLELEEEVSNAAFTVALFSGIKRKEGGPPAKRFRFLTGISPDCDPIEGLFSAPCEVTQLSF